MSKIVIYLDEEPIYASPLSTQRRIDAYSDLAFEIESLGSEVYIARSPSSYDGSGMFNATYKFDNNRNLNSAGRVNATTIFDKGDKSTLPVDGFRKINHQDVDILCDDKIEVSKVFSQFSPTTLSVPTYKDLVKALPKIPGIIKVFKPVIGFGGEGIIIDTDDQILKQANDDSLFPALVQEFIDTSGGIAGIVDGAHDLRVIVINGDIMQFSARKPAPGSLKANVQQGGSIVSIPIKKVPDEIYNIVTVVDGYLSQYGDRIYSVDVVYDGDNYRLIELNSRPGWHPISFGEEAELFVKKLARVLTSDE